MNEISESFQLPEEYRHAFPSQNSRGPNGISASMKAAANPDSQILRAVLTCRKPSASTAGGDGKGYRSKEELEDCYGPNSIVNWPGQDPVATPLLQAVRSQLLENVEILLEAGADPSGIDMDSLESYQALFLRFRPSIPPCVDIDGDVAHRRTLLDCMELPQTAPITEIETEERMYSIAPFWRFPAATQLDLFPGGDEMHSLVAAARQPSTQILDRLLRAGADALFWMSEESTEPDYPNPSSLAVTTPLHAAIESGNISMIHHLLASGFDANIIATSTPCSGLTPLMATFLTLSGPEERISPQQDDAVTPVSSGKAYPSHHTPASNMLSSKSTDLPSTFNLAAYNLLVAHGSTNLVATSPILSVHPFHLAVAHVCLPLLRYVLRSMPLALSDVSPTGLGHNLLHIACMPLSAHYIETRSRAICRSIHDTRDLCSPRMAPYRNVRLWRRSISRLPLRDCLQVHRYSDRHFFFPAQTELLRFLLSQVPHSALSHQDIYGNTPLHYLAAHRVVNDAALALLRSAVSGDSSGIVQGGHQERKQPEKQGDPFTILRNRWGYSARDLLEDTERAALPEPETVADATPSEKEMSEPDDKSAEIGAEGRDLTRRLNAWWDKRLEQHQQQQYDAAEAAATGVARESGSRTAGEGRGRGRGRGGIRGPIPMSPFRTSQLPYRSIEATKERQGQDTGSSSKRWTPYKS
jgi:ankyrin repeat protein